MGTFRHCDINKDWLSDPRILAGKEAQPKRVILQQYHTLRRDCLTFMLASNLPDLRIDSICEPAELEGDQCDLVIIGLDPVLSCDPLHLYRTFSTIRHLFGDVPICVILDDSDPGLLRMLAKFHISGILMPNSGIEIAVAVVRLMLAGGTFLPLEICHLTDVDDNEEINFARPSPETPANLPAGNDEDFPSAQEMTARERDVLRSLRLGLQNKIIAFDLGISESTVKVHLRNIMKKLHASNRTQVAVQTRGLRLDL